MKSLIELLKFSIVGIQLSKIRMLGLNLNPQQRTREPSFQKQPRQSDFQSLDLQYEICSKFMKMASEQLYHRELQLMNSTSKFMEKVQDSFMQKDISSTQESLTFQTFFDDDDAFSQPSRSRLLLRKSQSNASLRRTESGLNEALRQVQKSCSQKTSSMLSNMASEFRKIKEKLAGSEKFEKQLKKLQQRFNVSQQELLIARKRVSDLQKQNKTHIEEVQTLRKKTKELGDMSKPTTLALSRSSGNLLLLDNVGPTDKMKRYLEEKEVHIFKKQKEIRIIQDKIQASLDGIVGDGGCEKCCIMVKRVKESIMKYRSFMEEEANAAQTLYGNYKRLFS